MDDTCPDQAEILNVIGSFAQRAAELFFWEVWGESLKPLPTGSQAHNCLERGNQAVHGHIYDFDQSSSDHAGRWTWRPLSGAVHRRVPAGAARRSRFARAAVVDDGEKADGHVYQPLGTVGGFAAEGQRVARFEHVS